VAAVFRAFEKGSTGCMSARELPQALRLLGIEPEEPPVAKLVASTTADRGGVFDQHTFSTLIHRLLRRDFDEISAMATAAAPAAAVHKVERATLKPSPPFAAAAAPAPSTASLADEVIERLARAFVLAPSEENGSVALRDVPGILAEAGFTTAAEKVHREAASRTSQGLARMGFRDVIDLALEVGPPPVGSSAQADAPTSMADVASRDSLPLRLRVCKLTLAPWVLALAESPALCVLVHSTIKAPSGHAPVVVRSPLLQKQATPLLLEMEVRLPPGTSSVQFELLFEAAPDQLAPLASSVLDLADLYDASYPLNYTLPLIDESSRQTAALDLVAERLVSKMAPQPALSPPREPAVAAEPTVAELEAELRSLRARSAQLEQASPHGRQEVDAKHWRARPAGGGELLQRTQCTSWREWGSEAIGRAVVLLPGRNGSAVRQLLRESEAELSQLARDATARLEVQTLHS